MNINNRVISKVYVGKSGKCCCGCSGRYTYPEASGETPSRGIKVSDRSVKLISNRVVNSPDVVDRGSHAFIDDGTKVRIVYFK